MASADAAPLASEAEQTSPRAQTEQQAHDQPARAAPPLARAGALAPISIFGLSDTLEPSFTEHFYAECGREAAADTVVAAFQRGDLHASALYSSDALLEAADLFLRQHSPTWQLALSQTRKLCPASDDCPPAVQPGRQSALGCPNPRSSFGLDALDQATPDGSTLPTPSGVVHDDGSAHGSHSRDSAARADRLLHDPRISGDFLCAGAGAAPTADAWPTIEQPAMAARGDIPAVAPPIPPASAACRLDHTRQADAAALNDEPVSDYNSVTHSEPVALAVPAPPSAADLPTPGQPHTVFNDICEISWSEGGDWVRAYISRGSECVHRRPRSFSGSGPQRRGSNESKFVRWTSQQLFEQTRLWFASAQADKRDFVTHGSTHRPATRTLIIPAGCHRGGGKYIWDLQPLLLAEQRGEATHNITISPIDESAAISPRQRVDTLTARLEAAGIPDRYGIQQILELGLVSRSGAPRHTILQMNYPAVADHAAFASGLAQREALAAMLTSPWSGGIPLFPVRLNPFNAIIRPGKTPRLCCDLSSPQGDADGAGRDNVNAGIPFEDTSQQRRIAVVHGFFDDSLLGSFVFATQTVAKPGSPDRTRAIGPFELLVASLLVVAEDIGLPVADRKIECGKRGKIDIELWRSSRQIAWIISVETWSPWEKSSTCAARSSATPKPASTPSRKTSTGSANSLTSPCGIDARRSPSPRGDSSSAERCSSCSPSHTCAPRSTRHCARCG